MNEHRHKHKVHGKKYLEKHANFSCGGCEAKRKDYTFQYQYLAEMLRIDNYGDLVCYNCWDSVTEKEEWINLQSFRPFAILAEDNQE